MWNVEGRLQGQTMDVPLTETGFIEAAHAAAELVDRPLTALWSSDQLRALQTAGVVVARHDLTVRATPLLREQSLGDLEGRLASEMTEQPVPDGMDISEVRWGGGESIADVHERMRALVAALREEFGDDDEVALVSHGDALRVLLAVLEGKGHRDVDWSGFGTGSVHTVSLGADTDDVLARTIAAVQPASAVALAEAEQRQAQLTKPPGSLGALEVLANRLSAMAGRCPAPIPEPAVIGLFAGDHGVCAQGVSPWPQEVTASMVMNIAGGGAAINALARQVGASLLVTDVGVATDHPAHPAIRNRVVARGTHDFTVEPAMTRDEARAALAVGIEAAEEAIAGGARCLLTGEMGIGNTTPASALIAVFTRTRPALVTGRGAGADDQMLSVKTQVIERGLKLHQPQTDDPLGTLAAIGGLEHAALAGFILAGAAHRVPVVLDGVIACSAACVAAAFAPAVRDYLVSGHAGAEPGIRTALAHLGLQPLVDLGMRLGEGSGAAVALPMVQAAARIMAEMATFAEAGIEAGS
ncbi:nicotinate-nucleotide--dimethylbenzimidazole phosphoribosyltransferase [Tessaracoccus antarcticus]|uniref:Nicotinate-nucleotide--dimethylbenzimidazole phosphoribosyltransferase n=2 Tax=Tessaracoccus antarcticus TaxID=2479848 RepID=A0A3M0GWX5_9ACTN|nr:nicotinate-nucleotide--dimethylbenzimidazole phosphoribosyltransferase [Tessaracoccus antarcticus]